jgi:hypothetical protein
MYIRLCFQTLWPPCILLKSLKQIVMLYIGTVPSRRRQWRLIHLLSYHRNSNTFESVGNVPYCRDMCAAERPIGDWTDNLRKSFRYSRVYVVR